MQSQDQDLLNKIQSKQLEIDDLNYLFSQDSSIIKRSILAIYSQLSTQDKEYFLSQIQECKTQLTSSPTLVRSDTPNREYANRRFGVAAAFIVTSFFSSLILNREPAFVSSAIASVLSIASPEIVLFGQSRNRYQDAQRERFYNKVVDIFDPPVTTQSTSLQQLTAVISLST
jgi:hypothetical protein